MKIDARLKEQRFKNLYNLNPVYVWKTKNNGYEVGINGTSHHFGGLTKDKAEIIVSRLILAKK